MLKTVLSAAAIFLSISCSFAQGSSGAALQNRQRLEKERADIQKEIEDVKQSLDKAHHNKQVTLGQLALLERRLRLRESSIQNINAQIDLIQQDMDNGSRNIRNLRQELDTLRAQYAEGVVFAYKIRNSVGTLSFIFSAANFNDALKRIEYLNLIRQEQEQRAASIRYTQAEIQEKVNGLEVTRQQKDAALEKQSQEKNILEGEKKEKDVAVQRLGSQEKQLQRQLADKEKKDRQLAGQIEAVIRRARELAIQEARRKALAAAIAERKRIAAEKAEKARIAAQREKERQAAAERERQAAEQERIARDRQEQAAAATKLAAAKRERQEKEKEAKAAEAAAAVAAEKEKVAAKQPPPSDVTTGSGANTKTNIPYTEAEINLSGSFETNRGHLPWPVNSHTISMAFGLHTYMGNVKHFNQGLTIEAAAGSPVRAVFDGEVQSLIDMGDGQAVVVKHGKYFTTYSNLSVVSVSQGLHIKGGQVVGQVGSIGQLEFWLCDDQYRWLDPAKWLR